MTRLHLTIAAPPGSRSREGQEKHEKVARCPEGRGRAGGAGDTNHIHMMTAKAAKERWTWAALIRQGIKQRWWVPGMSAAEKASSYSDAETVLGNLLDFRNDTSAQQNMVENRGHILPLSLEFHPEVAGVGVEHLGSGVGAT